MSGGFRRTFIRRYNMRIQLEYAADARHAAEAADAIVWLLPDDAAASNGLPEAIVEAANKLLAKGLISREAGEAHLMPSLGLLAAEHVIVAGLGNNDPNAESLRRTGAAIARAAKKLKAESVCVLLNQAVYRGSAECRSSQAAQA